MCFAFFCDERSIDQANRIFNPYGIIQIVVWLSTDIESLRDSVFKYLLTSFGGSFMQAWFVLGTHG